MVKGPELGQEFTSITGFGGQYGEDYQLFPRSTADILTGINTEVLATVSIYPNPAKAYLNINNIQDVNKLVISNILGKAVLIRNISDNSMRINVSDLENGIYIVTLFTESGLSRSERIIKE